jgi:hypothetical protein
MPTNHRLDWLGNLQYWRRELQKSLAMDVQEYHCGSREFRQAASFRISDAFCKLEKFPVSLPNIALSNHEKSHFMQERAGKETKIGRGCVDIRCPRVATFSVFRFGRISSRQAIRAEGAYAAGDPSPRLRNRSKISGYGAGCIQSERIFGRRA